MTQRELEVRLQFLEEAQERLDTLESGLLGIGDGVNGKQVDALLRAAHSIKGGAALMSYQSLSELAHRLEDFFKILKTGRSEVDGDLESLLLSGVDRLRQIVVSHRQGATVEEEWLEAEAQPIFERLHDRLGDLQPDDEASLLSADAGEDIKPLLFQTEVESCLQRLESNLATPGQPCLKEEFVLAAQELGGLGEMLDLPAFSSLCESVLEQLNAAPADQTEAVASLALQEWRRSQALVVVGQIGVLPTQLELAFEAAAPQSEPLAEATDLFDLDALGDLEALSSASEDEAEQLLAEATDASLALDALGDLETLSSEPEADEAEQLLAEATNASLALDAIADLEALPSEPEADEAEQLLAEATNASLALDSINSLLDSDALQQEAQLSSLITSEEPEAPVTEIQPVPEPTPAPASPPPAPAPADNTIRISVRQLEQLSDLFGELTIERNGMSLHLQGMRDLLGLLRQRVRVLEQSNFRLRAAYDKVATEDILSPKDGGKNRFAILGHGEEDQCPQSPGTLSNILSANTFDLLEMDRYSNTHLLSQEVMETIVQVEEVTSDLELQLEESERTARELGRTSKLMQTGITQIRMRPIADLVGRFPRALRNMELQYGKKVDFRLKGGSTLIDRLILEALDEPLLHLLRNAFDHGIEDPATRQANGKPARGVIEVSAAYRGNQTVITIRDDGGGINLDKIRAKALQMGLDEEDLAKASKSDLLDLIFEPGFSTAKQVTDLSGRGVGMDVVRTNLKEIDGEVRVDTKLGQGTTFTISVPYTLSVVRVLLVESNGMMFAFPTSAVEEVLLLSPEMIFASAGQEILNWEGFMVSLIRLSQWLQLPPSRPRTETEAVPVINTPTALIVAEDDTPIALQVDRYWGEQEVTIRQVEGNLKLPPGLTGCTVLGDGRVVPLVDVSSLLRWITQNQSQTIAPAIAQPNFEVTDAKPTIMVVDDSINVRRFLALTLEKAGYRVEQGKDGQDALEKLQAGLVVQAIICDIEMPRLDGFGFLAQARSNPDYKQLPIVMLTSRSGNKHRQMAMTLGATDYFSKPFKEQQLLQTLENLIQKA